MPPWDLPLPQSCRTSSGQCQGLQGPGRPAQLGWARQPGWAQAWQETPAPNGSQPKPPVPQPRAEPPADTVWWGIKGWRWHPWSSGTSFHLKSLSSPSSQHLTLFAGSSPTSSLPWPGAALLGFPGCSHSNTGSWFTSNHKPKNYNLKKYIRSFTAQAPSRSPP